MTTGIYNREQVIDIGELMTELEELKTLAEEIGEYFTWEELDDSWELVEEGDWKQSGKYQYCETIVTKNGKYFAIVNSRTGSYHTDWYYDEPEIYEVEREEKIVIYWKKKA